jgi:hypothetical protein
MRGLIGEVLRSGRWRSEEVTFNLEFGFALYKKSESEERNKHTRYASTSLMVLQSAPASLISSGRLPAHTFFCIFASIAGEVAIFLSLELRSIVEKL